MKLEDGEKREEVEEDKRPGHNFSEAKIQVLRSRKRKLLRSWTFFENHMFSLFYLKQRYFCEIKNSL